MARGGYAFEVGAHGNVVDSVENLERLRALFRDESLIGGRWGPGDPGDFDHGSWHILCHLAAGSALLDTARGRAWAGIGWDGTSGRYIATARLATAEGLEEVPIADPRSRCLLAEARQLAFVEGTSQGHITARGIEDPPEAFNGCPRQMFDRDVDDPRDGGVVWEHWCTTRDIRASSDLGTSVLSAYLTLVSVLGGRFVSAVARGRRDHDHPLQLVALVRAGLLSREEALWDTYPNAIPRHAQLLFHEAQPSAALAACLHLGLKGDGGPQYFMFERRIHSWSPAAAVASDLMDA